LFPCPFLGNRSSAFNVIHDQNQLVVMIAVQHFDVNPGIGHSPCEYAELAWARLIESLDKHITHSGHPDASLFERRAGGSAIRKEKMGDAFAVDHPRAATFNAHSLPAQRSAHFSKRTRPVFKRNGQILH
jgi:hypothetical protein